MLRHYLELKSEYPDAILFYRMGDFYELFFDDALQVAPLLDLTLTARQKGRPTKRRCAECRTTRSPARSASSSGSA